jgi:hypothetical protein
MSILPEIAGPRVFAKATKATVRMPLSVAFVAFVALAPDHPKIAGQLTV